MDEPAPWEISIFDTTFAAGLSASVALFLSFSFAKSAGFVLDVCAKSSHLPF